MEVFNNYSIQYIYCVVYFPNCEEVCHVFYSLSKKRCLNFIKSHTCSSYYDYWHYYGSKIMYKPDVLKLQRVKLDSFRQYRN